MTIFEIIALLFVICMAAEIIRRMLRKEVDTARLDAVQANNWTLAVAGGEFAVVGGSPPKMIGKPNADLRKAIDEAIWQDAQRAEEEMEARDAAGPRP